MHLLEILILKKELENSKQQKDPTKCGGLTSHPSAFRKYSENVSFRKF